MHLRVTPMQLRCAAGAMEALQKIVRTSFIPGPDYFLFFFPVLQVGHDGFHMGADLFGGPLLVCHVGDAEFDQLRRAGVTEFAAVVAPLAVVLVERAVRLLAGGGVLQRHAAALADQLPGRAQERID